MPVIFCMKLNRQELSMICDLVRDIIFTAFEISVTIIPDIQASK